jgi:nicotinate-nucleotide adenylyltransferase
VPQTRIGVFGGTFDPPHTGHLIVAADVAAALDLDHVRFMPNAVPPHKRRSVCAPAALRLAMVQAAIQDNQRFVADDIELQRPGPSYTADTLAALGERHPRAELYFMIGVDALRDFGTWHQPARIPALARVVGLTRSGDAAVAPPGLPVIPVQVTRVDITATDIRRRVREGESIRYLVPGAVRDIIIREELYRNEDEGLRDIGGEPARAPAAACPEAP